MRKNDLQSRTIDVLRFLLIFYVVLIHSYSSTRGMVEAGDFSGYRFVSFLFSLEIAQVAVPSLFFISGYLFFCRPQPYGMKLRKEARSLLVPYLLWNALILLLYFCLQSIPALSHFFSGNNLPVRDYGLTDFFRGGLGPRKRNAYPASVLVYPQPDHPGIGLAPYPVLCKGDRLVGCGSAASGLAVLSGAGFHGGEFFLFRSGSLL